MGNRNEGLNYIIWYVLPIERKKNMHTGTFQTIKGKTLKKTKFASNLQCKRLFFKRNH